MMIRSMARFFFFSKMSKKIILLLLVVCSPMAAQLAGSAGGFVRMGFGARGIAMGNAMVAVNDGEISSYYNPALAAFSQDRVISVSASLLSFDRYLNFLSYTQSIKPTAGISLGIINSGVRNIDGRDEDGQPTDIYSTTENQFYLAFSNRVDKRVALGVSVKLYYGKLFDQVTSTTVGFDLGGYVQVTDNLGIGATIQDLNSKYTWNTQQLYGQPDGRTTEDNFPTLRKIGAAYTLFGEEDVLHPRGRSLVILSAEFENSSLNSNIFRAGGEYSPIETFSIRAGIDRLDGSDSSTGAEPSFGFSIKNSFNGWTPVIHYAYMIEPYASHGIHVISISGAL
jgi:hypothetical protein